MNKSFKNFNFFIIFASLWQVPPAIQNVPCTPPSDNSFPRNQPRFHLLGSDWMDADLDIVDFGRGCRLNDACFLNGYSKFC